MSKEVQTKFEECPHYGENLVPLNVLSIPMIPPPPTKAFLGQHYFRMNILYSIYSLTVVIPAPQSPLNALLDIFLPPKSALPSPMSFLDSGTSISHGLFCTWNWKILYEYNISPRFEPIWRSTG